MPTTRKLIGLVTNFSDESRFWLNANYVRYYETYGTVTLIDPLSVEVNEDLDLLVMPGGADISPGRYNSPHFMHIGMPNRAYEVWDALTLPHYIEAKIPMHCVCRGHQSINVFFGGGLNSHDENHAESAQDGSPVHYAGSIDKKIMFRCSSNHHQTVREQDLSPEFEPLLWSYDSRTVKKGQSYVPEPGDREDVIESMMHKTLPIFTTQYHPEKNYFAYDGKSTCPALERWTRDCIMRIMR